MIWNTVGGDGLDDFERRREDPGLAEWIGHEISSPAAAHNFLYHFHAPEKSAEAQRSRIAGLPEQIAYIAEESEALQGRFRVHRDLVQGLGQRGAEQKTATVDGDATRRESRKREAQPTSAGGRGYQPPGAVWAKTGVVWADQFRDGNVPAQRAPLPVAPAACGALPPTVTAYDLRGDAACHEHEWIDWRPRSAATKRTAGLPRLGQQRAEERGLAPSRAGGARAGREGLGGGRPRSAG